MVRSRPELSYTRGHVGDPAGVDPGAQRTAEERLPDIGRVAGPQPRGQRDLDIAAAAAGDGSVDRRPRPGSPALKAFSSTSKAGCSDGDTHQDTTSSRSVESEKFAFWPPPPQAARTSASMTIQ